MARRRPSNPRRSHRWRRWRCIESARSRLAGRSASATSLNRYRTRMRPGLTRRSRRGRRAREGGMFASVHNDAPMDNLCHTLVGAAFGEAGLKRRTRFGNVTLMIASNLPDIDVLAFATGTPSVALRRGWTHGILAQLCLPILLTALVLAVTRRRPDAAQLMPGVASGDPPHRE